MSGHTPNPSLLSAGEMRELGETLSGISAHRSQLATRLQYVSDLLADAGPLGQEPLLLWRERDHIVKHVTIGSELAVGRQTSGAGLTLPEDNLLSRRHFQIRAENEDFLLEDLHSHNGTFVNDPEQKVQQRMLCNGDLILAGNHIFAFLDQRAGQ